jgi:plastocyanin
MNVKRLFVVSGLAAATVLSACKSDKPSNCDTASAAASSAASGPAAGGKIIEVKLITDDAGSRFEPSKIEVHKGDLLRFVLQVGVHNVHFLPDSNAGKSGLPAPSEMLQLPGQTYDLPITLAPGHYYFQCDPHAALGMVGHLEVED